MTQERFSTSLELFGVQASGIMWESTGRQPPTPQLRLDGL